MKPLRTPEKCWHRGTLVHIAAAVGHRKASPRERHTENVVSAEDPKPKTDRRRQRTGRHLESQTSWWCHDARPYVEVETAFKKDGTKRFESTTR